MRVHRLGGFINSMLGLILKKKIEPVFLKTRFGIHSFFVKESIDVVILDQKFVVRKIKNNMKPFRVFFWNPKYSRVIEGPAGLIKKFQLKEGKRVDLEYD